MWFLRVLEKSPNLQWVSQSVAGVERLMWTFSAPHLEHKSYSHSSLQPAAEPVWKRGTSGTRLDSPSGGGGVKTAQGRYKKNEIDEEEGTLQCLTMPSGRLQLAGFVERCCLCMFPGSFQCNFLPLSMGTQPVTGQKSRGALCWVKRGRPSAVDV